mgnify:CR=1 FL=1
MFRIARNNHMSARGARKGFIEFSQQFLIGAAAARLQNPAPMSAPGWQPGYDWAKDHPDWRFDQDGLTAINRAAAAAWSRHKAEA